jgi:anti-sigma factor RsiW
MSKELKNIKEIDGYLSGELTPEHRTEFEKKLEADAELQEGLTQTKEVIEGIQGHAFKEMLKDLHSKLFPDNS